MKKYWKKINLKIVSAIGLRANIACKKHEDYIEAAILQTALVEAMLRISITDKTGSRSKRFKKYWDGDARFSQLIDYYELLGGEKSLIKKLRNYNKLRNKIVHHAVEYSSIHKLVADAKRNYLLGEQIERLMLKKMGYVPRKVNN